MNLMRPAIWLLLVTLSSAALAVDLPGLRPDGSVLLPNQWSLRPAGRQIALGDFPVNLALHPAGQFAAVLHSGHGQHEIAVVDLRQEKIVSRAPLHETFYGLQFSPKGDSLYCSGAGDEVIHAFACKDGQLTASPDIPLRGPSRRGIPCGLAVSADGRELFVANVWGQSVSQINLVGRANLADIYFTPASAPAPPDPAAPDAPFPYTCQIDSRRGRLYVSLWAQSCVAEIDLKSRQVLARWPTQEHPNEMALDKSARRLFVANANRNTVTVFDPATGAALETLDASLSPNALPGSTPNSLALSPDETKLFVANACNNNVAVFDISVAGHAHALGFIPVGWYPTSVRVTPDGRRLLVVNGKGLASKANPKGPQPGKRADAGTEYITELFPGALSIIDLPASADWPKQMADYTAQCYQCAPQPAPAPAAADNPVPAQPGQPSPIKYCIYIIKENRTYDQFLGDLPQGNGDPKLCLFPENITPNHHKLARDFVLLDNFHVDAEVSADGHEWSMGAYASDFVEKTWPLNYGHNFSKKYPYPSEGDLPIAAPASGYIWDRALAAGVSYRSYGEFVIAGKNLGDPNWTKIPALKGHIDPSYHVFDLAYPDQQRAVRFIAELKRFEAEGEMPRLQIVRLPNDHTEGARVGELPPTSYVGDNDLALGRVVEAISHSKFWPQTAIFVLEDDAQNGPDHVDAHRSPAFLISPYVRRAAVDSTMYSTSSMLRSIELILGLKPMTQFDAAAMPMFRAFQAAPDLRPYDALPAGVSLDRRNTLASWGHAASQKMDFTREDATDEATLNEIIWRSVRGPSAPMPAPVHAAFVFPLPKPAGDDDDD
jgi:DNA-binding beta-propeller fold protein YncE